MAEAYSFGILVLLATVLGSDAVLSADRITVFSDDVPVKETVVFDTSSNVVLTNVEPVQTGRISICEMSNLHDFNKGIVGLKSIAERICFITPLQETFAELKDVVRRVKQGEKYDLGDWFLNLNTTVIPRKDMPNIAGDKVTEFCEGFPSYWMDTVGDRLPANSETSHHRTRRSAGCDKVCGVCRAMIF